jgi:hypothetical protein
MNPTYAKLQEARDIAAVLLASPYAPAMMPRLHHLLESALEDFFQDADDTAGLPDWWHDRPGFPTA